MNIEKVIQDDRQAKLTVEYTAEEFEGFKRRAAKKISKNAKIPGFRPGKAPYAVIVNHYGEGAIVQEALDLLIDDDYPKILKEAEVEPAGVGNLETIETLDPPKFILFVPLEPEIDLGDYREIRKDYEMEAFDTATVENYITQLRRNSATIVPAERAAQAEDLVYFTLSGEFLNPGESEEATITDKTPQQVIIPGEDEQDGDEWPYPGFSRALLGVQAGDVKELQHTYPEDYEDEEFQGKTAMFTVEVQSIKALELPELDEDFIQSMGNFESPEDFREKLEENMRAEHEQQYELEYFNAVLGEIIENATLNYPPQMLEHEKEHVLEDIKSRLENQNLDFETYLKLRNTDEETFIEEEVNPVAKQRLERSLVVDALIEAEQLNLDKELFNQQINVVMNDIFRSGQAEQIQKEMGNEEFSRMISMEGVSRTMNTQLRNRLKLIGTGQPIPDPSEMEEAVEAVEEPAEPQAQAEDGEKPGQMESSEPEALATEQEEAVPTAVEEAELDSDTPADPDESGEPEVEEEA